MIQHIVAFKLKHHRNTSEEQAFLRAAKALSEIPGVRDFKCLRQIGTKNDFTFGLSMNFLNEEDYATYCAHPIHEKFVQEKWIPEVEEFMEIDYTPYSE